MNQSIIFYPLIAHALLVLCLFPELGRRRFIMAKKGAIKQDDYLVYKPSAEPDFIGKVSRNITNNFEVPILFHSVILALYLTNLVTYPLVYLAWAFFFSRFCHTLVHITYNKLIHRGLFFIISYAITLILWLTLAYKLWQGE